MLTGVRHSPVSRGLGLVVLRLLLTAALIPLVFGFTACGSGDSPVVDAEGATTGPLVWRQQVTLDDSALSDVLFVDAAIGWAVGSDGAIITTRDGGASWQAQEAGLDASLTSLAFPNVETGWVVGHSWANGGGGPTDGVILATVDGGATWIKQRSPLDVAPTDVCFIDQDRGWVVGYHGTIATRDGGETWIQQKTKTPPEMHAVDFVDARHGWVVGSTGPNFGWSNAYISATDDGGRSWTRQFRRSALWLTDVSFIDAKLGWAVGFRPTAPFKPWLMRTDDGGRTWLSMPLRVERGRFHGAGLALEAVQFLDADRGWVAASTWTPDGCLILATSDGGASWREEFASERDEISSLFILDTEHGWAAGVLDVAPSGAGEGVVMSGVRN